jgi:hypothetical protein
MGFPFSPGYPYGMFQYVQYFDQAQGIRSRFASLPTWARGIVGIAAVPGIALALLSILLLIVSIIALLLLTMPVYRLLQLVCFSRPNRQEVTVDSEQDADIPSGRRQVDAKVIE